MDMDILCTIGTRGIRSLPSYAIDTRESTLYKYWNQTTTPGHLVTPFCKVECLLTPARPSAKTDCFTLHHGLARFVCRCFTASYGHLQGH